LRQPRAEARSRVILALVLLCSACGRNPAQVRWDDDLAALVHAELPPPAEADGLMALAARAPRASDAGFARLEAARTLMPTDPLAAAKVLQAMALDAPRRPDRARAHYELARLAESRGRLATAVRAYRALVLHYPDEMPGERALAHLMRIARARGDRAVDQHLAWTRSVAETLDQTGLGDDLLYQAADEARARAERDPTPARWDLALQLYSRLIADRPRSPLWNDALWERSWLHHRRHAYEDELLDLRRILTLRSASSFIGQDEHVYFWEGQLRIARLLRVQLKRPAEAARAYLDYAAMFPKTIKKDDVRFFALCAELSAGHPEVAHTLADLIRREHPDSKFLRRLDAAFADPEGPHCLAPEATR
jgi:tetratricopeptide (TPR) repeat protein